MTTKTKIAIAAAFALLLGGGTGLLMSRQGTSTIAAAAKPAEVEIALQNQSEPPPEPPQNELKEAKKPVRLELRHTLKETNVVFVTNSDVSVDGEMLLLGDSGSVRLTPGTKSVRVRKSSGFGVGGGAGGSGGAGRAAPATPPEQNPQYIEVK